MSTTNRRVPRIGQLDLADYSWLRADIGDLGGVDPQAVLRGVMCPGRIVARADPSGAIGDLIGTYWAALFLASTRFVDLVRRARLTGWRALDVRVEGNPEVRDVALLQVLGVSGPVLRSGIGRSLDLRTWDGSDFFVPRNEGTILLSPRAVDVLTAAQLRNVEVTPASIELD